MTIIIKYGTEHTNLVALCEICRLAPLGIREPGKLEFASQNSHTVCSAYLNEEIIGFGRAISDGQYQSVIYDVVVLPDYQNQGIGKLIMESLIEKLPKSGPVLMLFLGEHEPPRYDIVIIILLFPPLAEM
ncbi:MAG: hypothetical protein BA862_00660 [Desulfobulbaceae bacterium S3730MH12]|nr:MAG: hypothetical protein BA862_00660 [Desulfobulbaceae bacterium S3730MH12]